MTLILSLITHGFAVQVSDRRVTDTDGTLFEDEKNKCIFYYLNGTITYTGFARIGNESTADWALLPLSEGVNLASALNLLRDTATATFHGLQRPAGITQSTWLRAKRTTFVCLGFHALRNPGNHGLRKTVDDLHAFVHKVSNAERPDGTWNVHAADTFHDSLQWLGDRRGYLTWSGASLRASEKIKMSREVRRCLARTHDPESAARLLARQVREVHERQERSGIGAAATVGKSVMCALVTRPEVRFPGGDLFIESNLVPVDGSRIEEESLFRAIPNRKSPRYIYYPRDALQLVHYGPNWVLPDLAIKGLRLGPV
jgi:hypothetical protein